YLLVAGGKWILVSLESALGDFKRSFGNANRFRQLICGTESIKFIVEDGPKSFFPLHQSSPTLAYLANESGGEILSSQRQCLPFISGYVATHEEARRSGRFIAPRKLFAIFSG